VVMGVEMVDGSIVFGGCMETSQNDDRRLLSPDWKIFRTIYVPYYCLLYFWTRGKKGICKYMRFKRIIHISRSIGKNNLANFRTI